MSGEEEDSPPTDDPPAVLTGAAAASATETAITCEYAPLVRYSAGADLELWLKRAGQCTKTNG